MGDTANLSLSWRSVMLLMICLPIIACVFLLLCKKIERFACYTLAALLFVIVLSIVPQIIGFAGFYQVWPGLTFLPVTTSLWLGPLFYIHAYLLLKEKPLGWRKYLLIPGVLQTAYYTWAFFGLGDYQAKWAFNDAFHEPYIVPIESGLAILMMLLALFRVNAMYKQYTRYLHNTQSAAVEFDPNWLDKIILAMLVAGVLFSSIQITQLFVHLSYVSMFPIQVMIIITVAWLSVEAVWRLDMVYPKMPRGLSFKQRNDNEFTPFIDSGYDVLAQEQSNAHEGYTGGTRLQKTILQSNSEFENIQRPKIDSQQALQQQGDDIKVSVQQNNWYLQARFSLKQLAKNMASNEVYISRAINKGLGLSFNDFINQLRIQHAIGLITTTELPLLNIALDSGFNSKATFNRVFKYHMHCTPSQFRQNNQVQ